MCSRCATVAAVLVDAAQGAVPSRVSGPRHRPGAHRGDARGAHHRERRAVHADVGDAVTRGAVLVELDDRDLAARRAVVGRQREALARNVKAAQASVERARADLELARSKRRRDAELLRTGYVSQAAFDASDAALRAAEAGLENARSPARRPARPKRRRSTRSRATPTPSSRSRGSPRRSTASSCCGRRRSARPSSPAARSFASSTRRRCGSRRASTSPSSGACASARPRASGLRTGDTVPGKVARIARQADAATRELEVNVAFDTPPASFAIDQEADVAIVTGEETGVVVPLSALVRDRDGPAGRAGRRRRSRRIPPGHAGAADAQSRRRRAKGSRAGRAGGRAGRRRRARHARAARRRERADTAAGPSMDLAVKDIRRHVGKFFATIAGVAMLLAIVLVMNGIYQGNIADGVWLIDNTATDLWVVERGRGGPFNESSRMPAGQLPKRRGDAGRRAGEPARPLHGAARHRRHEPAVHDRRLRRLRRPGRSRPHRAGPRRSRRRTTRWSPTGSSASLRATGSRSATHDYTVVGVTEGAVDSRPATRSSTCRCRTRRRCSSSRTTARSRRRARPTSNASSAPATRRRRRSGCCRCCSRRRRHDQRRAGPLAPGADAARRGAHPRLAVLQRLHDRRGAQP